MPRHLPDRSGLARPLTRRAAIVGGALVLSGCSLRLEKGSSLPGPKKKTPPDIAPLGVVRQHVLSCLHAEESGSSHTDRSRPLAALRRRQLTHLDATLKGLGAPTPSASPSTPAKSADWMTEERAWSQPSMLGTIAGISKDSRPMVLSLAATGLAAAMAAGSSPAWDDAAELPADGAEDLLTALSTAIDALEWSVSRKDPDKRGQDPAMLSWLYAARSMAQAAAPSSGSASPAPVRQYRDDKEAGSVTTTALRDLLPACARAAQAADMPHRAAGVLLVWSHGVAELSRRGAPDRSDFPGLTAA